MEIDINQAKIAIGDKYKIFIDGQPAYAASRALLQLLPEIQLYKVDEGRPRMTINKLFSWFKPKYDITRWDNNLLEFRTTSVWKMEYECHQGLDAYAIYGHAGRKFSIFKNRNQVAWWDKQAVEWFAGDNYKIIADSDADVDLIVTFCLIADNFESEDHNNQAVTIDLGNIGFGQRKFDPTWQPK